MATLIKPVPILAPPVPEQPNAPVTRTWTGADGANFSASDASDWTPAGAPQPGDTLRMVGGRMDIAGNDLQGDTLWLGLGNNIASNMTLNLSHNAALTLEAVGNSREAVTINATDDSHLNIDGAGFSSHATYNLNVADTLTTEHIDLTSAVLNLNGGLMFLNQATVALHGESQLYARGDLSGTGYIAVGDSSVGDASAEFDKSVGSGVTINAIGDANTNTASNVLANDPSQFSGQVNLDFGSLILATIHADSYAFQNDLLSLYNQNTVVDTVHLSTVGSLNSLHVYQSAVGVTLDTSGHASGNMLPLHT
jgi:hypothetical protein